MGFPHVWQTSKRSKVDWRCWMGGGILGYMELEEADESWRPGKILESFPNCSGEIKACWMWVRGRAVQLLDSPHQCPSCDGTMWLEEGAGFRGFSHQPPFYKLSLMHKHTALVGGVMLQLPWRDPGKSHNRDVERKSNPGIKKGLHHMQVIFKGWHCCFPRQQQARRQLGWAGDQGEAESYHLQPRWELFTINRKL